MSSTSRVEPPQLTGFDYVRYLGGGGFADVYLYRQRRPARDVAIKILKETADSGAARTDFDAEADLMAQVSTHPFIVTIYDAGISADGQPFLVMEYYPRDHLGARAQLGMSVSEVLRVGVQVSSAVETLHQAGIVHRDIKPANILVSEFNKPGLTDFGIAGAHATDEDQESRGASIPYAPPEVVNGRSIGDQRADVYSLAATIYTLLARRTPFEQGNPARGELIQRILTGTAPPLDRPDVPRSLELLLQQCLAKDPGQRPQSAEALATALQSIERELRLDPTPLEIREIDSRPQDRSPDPTSGQTASADSLDHVARMAAFAPQAPVATPQDDSTRGRPAVVRPLDPSTVARPAVVPPPAAATIARPATPTGSAPPAATVARPSTPATATPTGAPEASPTLGSKARLAVTAVATLAAILVGVVVLTSSSEDAPDTGEQVEDLAPVDLDALARPETPQKVRIRPSGRDWLVTWTVDGDVEPKYWLVIRKDAFVAEDAEPTYTRQPKLLITGLKPGQRPCLNVAAGVTMTNQWSAPTRDLCGPTA